MCWTVVNLPINAIVHLYFKRANGFFHIPPWSCRPIIAFVQLTCVVTNWYLLCKLNYVRYFATNERFNDTSILVSCQPAAVKKQHPTQMSVHSKWAPSWLVCCMNGDDELELIKVSIPPRFLVCFSSFSQTVLAFTCTVFITNSLVGSG